MKCLISKKLKDRIYNQHIGTGVLVYKSAEKTLTIQEFFVDRKDKTLKDIESGTPLEFDVLDKYDY